MCREFFTVLVFSVYISVSGCYQAEAIAELPEMTSNRQPIKQKTVRNSTFLTPLQGLAVKERILFRVGESFFSDPWLIAPASTTLRDGLGPYFNSRTCSDCHVRGARSPAPDGRNTIINTQIRLASTEKFDAAGGIADPLYGQHLQQFAIPVLARITAAGEESGFSHGEGRGDVSYEYINGKFRDGEGYQLRRPVYQLNKLIHGELKKATVPSLRIAPSLAGAGLLEAIDDESIILAQDPHDSNADGISGRVNYVPSSLNDNSPILRVGRFGHKARHANIHSQAAAAFRDDIGITNPLFADESCTSSDSVCSQMPNGVKPGKITEIDDTLLSQVSNFIRLLAPPPANRTSTSNQTGKRLFKQAQCAACHTPTHITSSDAVHALLASREIQAYTDLLLHDMGDDLSDQHVEFNALGNEWRTAPLWGLSAGMRLNNRTGLLHDGRARNTTEAILWHGGEAISSRNNFFSMTKQQRNALTDFIESL